MLSIIRRRRLNKDEEGDKREAARVVVRELRLEEDRFSLIVILSGRLRYHRGRFN